MLRSGVLYMIQVYVEDYGDIITIALCGLLTRDTLKEAEESWTEQLDRKPQMLAFNLRELTQIDSVAINHLFKLATSASANNVPLIIYDMNEGLSKVFEVIKLDRIIPIISRRQFETDYLKNR